jgi:hypothetical protein
MKFPFFLLISLFFLSAMPAHSQMIMTVTTGISPQQSPNGHYIFVNRSAPRDEFTFDLAQVKASYFVGVGGRYDLKPFFFSGEAQYNKREYIYDVSYTYPGIPRTVDVEQYNETMQMINIPLSVGVDLGIVQVSSGLLPQLIISHQSELEKLEGYSKKRTPFRMGWQSGLETKISNLRIGLNWQMDFNNYADHLFIGNQPLTLQGRPSRILGTFSYDF